MNQFSKMQTKFNNIKAMIQQEKHSDALKAWEELKSEYPNDMNIILNEPALLIDIGGIVKDQEMLTNGINKGRTLLEKGVPAENKAVIHYNVGNGYLNLFGSGPRDNALSRINNDNLQSAKYHFRQALKSNPNDGLMVNILANYGNCLDSLGRSLDALYCYDDALGIDPNHSMSIGNRALAKLLFANISGAYRTRTYIETYQELRSIIDKEDLLLIGGYTANESFKEKSSKIEVLFDDKSMLDQDISCGKDELKYSTVFEEYYFDFCKKHRLFLNFHTGTHNCQYEILDSAFISIITRVDEGTRFYSLAKKVNDIKEDFLTSKLLLAQSEFRRDDFDNISQKVIFANTLDYANNTIYTALLKSSFRICYNILDKIAFFINDYLNLNMKDSRIYFHT